MADLLRTPLHCWHDSHRARLVDFAGWEMPVLYTSIVDEHVATRTAIGVFDISHMGRLQFEGEGALRFLDRMVTRRVADMKPGQVRYALVTNHQGGILDDVLVYCLPQRQGTSRVMMVVNAANRAKIVAWLQQHGRETERVTLRDVTRETAMVAVQGPASIDLIASLVDVDLRGMKYYSGAVARFGPIEVVMSRTGYTGEEGCELMVPASAALDIWQRILDQGDSQGARPVGLAARDTLRLEAGMPLYGHELSEQIHPFQAGLGFAVQTDQRDFIGRDALVIARSDTACRRRVGLRLPDRRVPREHYAVVSQGHTVGEVTSGTFSPTLDRPIAMAYVDPSAALPGQTLQVDIRGRLAVAEVVELPFYSRTSLRRNSM
ncbi:MAG: glycine cleavage system aminomethyltransferase GcvT [Pirellulaceae bacterium]